MPTTTVSPTEIPTLHQVPGIVQAEDYITGGEGVGYHDTSPTNLGGTYRTDGVDIESTSSGAIPQFIRDGEWTRCTLNVTASGFFGLTCKYSVRGLAILSLCLITIPSSARSRFHRPEFLIPMLMGRWRFRSLLVYQCLVSMKI
ncbi:carbohydrate-binding protein [Methanosphaerula palustris]|uniref:hypothetical protein n=1 Tax=Methanosphaerula palustris TaxID=475088 RepID=UPI00018486A0|nr:hypothetical protein [Methanosphaerula palustris]